MSRPDGVPLRDSADNAKREAAIRRVNAKIDAAREHPRNSLASVRARIEELSADFETKHPRDARGRFARKRRLRAAA
jgi:hypothetical protein